MKLKRDKYCGEFSEKDAGRDLTAAGFVSKVRDLGNLIFIDLRDRSGILQLAADDLTAKEVIKTAKELKSEDVILAKGRVRERENKNYEIKTGMIELYLNEIEVVSKAALTPFEIDGKKEAGIDLRLKYRYLDLRRKSMQKSVIKRHKIVKTARDYFDSQGFLEIETPMLVKSTPEGARDFLVPSRTKRGKFFALPQSPQLYKQLLMVAGFDKYFQVARCFRDEDLRADRQNEFTQLDLEMSFVDEDDVIAVNEGFMKTLFREVLGIELKTPFRRVSYEYAMNKYGSDKPDLRFDMTIKDLSAGVKGCEFKIFGEAAEGNGVRGINLKGQADKISRKKIDKLTQFVKDYGAKGLAYSKISSVDGVSSYEKFLKEDEIRFVNDMLEATEGDIIFIVADKDKMTALESLGALRNKLAKDFNLYDPNEFSFEWVYGFPLFEFDSEEGRLVAKHHPFTCVCDEDRDKLKTNPTECRAKAYDLILNGCELGGGSIRISDRDLQREIFEIIGIKEHKAKENFGFLLDAFEYGVPPHGGMAYGLDRLVMLMLKKDSIRDVIAFPKVQSGAELMSGAPQSVDNSQLEELNLQLTD